MWVAVVRFCCCVHITLWILLHTQHRHLYLSCVLEAAIFIPAIPLEATFTLAGFDAIYVCVTL